MRESSKRSYKNDVFVFVEVFVVLVVQLELEATRARTRTTLEFVLPCFLFDYLLFVVCRSRYKYL